MDPITAVGFAASVLTFIDFSWNLVHGSYEIYKSGTGTTSDIAHVGNVVDDLRQVTDKLKCGFSGDDENEKALARLGRQCIGLSKDLDRVLKKLKAKDDTKWESLKVAWKSMRKEKEVSSIERRLADYRGQIVLRLSLMMSNQHSTAMQYLDRLEKESAKLSADNGKRLTELRSDVLSILEQLSSDSATSASRKPPPPPSSSPRREAATGSLNVPAEDNQAGTDAFGKLQMLLDTLESKVKTLPKENYILSRLYFASMHQREDTVDDAQHGTFEWIVHGPENTIPGSRRDSASSGDHNHHPVSDADDEGPDDKSASSRKPRVAGSTESMPGVEVKIISHDDEDEDDESESEESGGEDMPSRASSTASFIGPRHYATQAERAEQAELAELEERAESSKTFLSFLNEDHGLFFVCGKAGSGKSTLMKFLGYNDVVRDNLQRWSGDKTLCVGHFFFWNSGNNIQMSLEGLYRSILFETLVRCPDLLQHIFPEEWRGPYFDNTPFRLRELHVAIERLFSTHEFASHRFCYFIDGLDEYDGDSVEHFKLARLLLNWGKSLDVKIVCSARPHTEFLDTFTDSSRVLHLHRMTRGDIRTYATTNIHEQLERSNSLDALKDYQGIVDEVIWRADGVFLWARLVVRSVITGMAHDDSPKTLFERVQDTPQDLDHLFSRMLRNVDLSSQARSTTMLLWALNTPRSVTGLSALQFSWIDELDDESFPYGSPVDRYSAQELERRDLRVRRQLSVYTNGLLEISTDSTRPLVVFFHRTVYDYLTHNINWRERNVNEQKVKTPTVGDYYRLYLADLKWGPDPKRVLSDIFSISCWPDFRSYALPDHFLDELMKLHCNVLQSTREGGNTRGWHVTGGLVSSRMEPARERPNITCVLPFDWNASPSVFIILCKQARYLRSQLEKSGLAGFEKEEVLQAMVAASIIAENAPDLDGFIQSCLRNSVRPSDRVPVKCHFSGPLQETTSEVSIWVLFLYDLANLVKRFISGGELPGTPILERLSVACRRVQIFSESGADRSAVILVQPQTPSNKAPTLDGVEVIQEESALFYVELSQLLDLFSDLIDVKYVQKLIKPEHSTGIWAVAATLMDRVKRRQPASGSVRNRYRPLNTELIKDAKAWRIRGIASDTEELLDEFVYALYPHPGGDVVETFPGSIYSRPPTPTQPPKPDP